MTASRTGEVSSRGVSSPGAAGLLAVLVLAVSWPALFGDFILDDEFNIQRNVALRTGDLWEACTRPFFRDPYWRPVTSLAMTIGYRLGGLLGIHLVALVVHAAAAIVAFRVAARVFGDQRAAFAVAALFAVHPVQVEGIAWASALSDPMCGLFVLLATASVLKWRDSARAAWPWRPAAWLLLALLAKESAAMAVPLLVLVACCRPGSRPGTREVRLLLALAAAVAVWIALRSLVPVRPPGAAVPATAAAIAAAPFGAVFAEMMVRPLVLLAVPFPLLPFHALDSAATTATSPGVAWRWIVAFAVLVAVVAVSWRRLAEPMRIAQVFLLVPLVLPALLGGRLGDYPIAERYLYLPAFGFALMLVAPLRRRPGWLAIPAVLGAIVSFDQTWVWQDQRSFVAHCVRRAPDTATVHAMAGNLQVQAAQRGDWEALDRARLAYDRARRLVQSHATPDARKQWSVAEVGLAWCELLAQQRNGRVDGEQLARRFRTALAADGSAAPGWVGLGVAHALVRQFDAAEKAFHRALELDDRCPEAWFNLGYMQHETGRIEEARRSLRRALECDPGLTPAEKLLAQLR